MRIIDETTLQSYKNHIYTQEKSQNTIDKYIRDIRTFTAWLQTQEHKDITKDCVIRYKKYLEAHYRPSSTNSMLTALNGFFEYTGWHDCRVMTLKTQPNHIYAQEKEMTRTEYEKLIKTAKEQDNLRLAMIIETIGGTGIRVSELASITVDAVKTGKWKPGGPQQHLDGNEKGRRKSRRCTGKSIPAQPPPLLRTHLLQHA